MRFSDYDLRKLFREMRNGAIVASGLISAERDDFVQEDKQRPQDGKDDIVTSADDKAEEEYKGRLGEFTSTGTGHGLGVYSEEKWHVPSKLEDCYASLRIDPLDGTKAFARHDLTGVATQVALVHDREVLAAYYVDVMTRELYGFDTKKLWLPKWFTGIDIERPLSNQALLMRKWPQVYHPLLQKLAAPKRGFKDILIESGSITLSAHRLFIGNVGALALADFYETPWDQPPMWGMAKRLGFVMLRPNTKGTKLVRYTPSFPEEFVHHQNGLIMVHESRVEELNAAVAA